ncbi:MAG: hypothetical protein K2F81_04065, partial [Ruminococcus sp.]|nr:hypothetical protein [Ruminococcus sp.]
MAKKLIACMLSISMAATALVTPLGEHVSKLFKLPTFSTNAIQIEDTFNLDDSSETIIKFKTDISKSNPIVNLSGTNFSYTGKAITPFVSFRRSSTAVRDLKVGTEITVSYKNNVNPGTATVIITGINEYKGTVTKTFTISDQTTSADEEVIKTGSEETIWTGSEDLGKWNKDVDLGIAGIPLAEEGGILTIIYQDKGTAQISVINKVGDSWIWTELIDSATGNVYFETTGGKLQIKLTAEQAKQFATSKAIFLKGQNVIVTKMTYTAPGSDDSDDSSKTETTGTIINIENPVTDAWNNCFPKYDSGYGKEIDDYIDAKTFTKDTAMDVTVNFEWVDG